MQADVPEERSRGLFGLGGSNRADKEARKEWQSAFMHWEGLLADDRFWTFLATRIASYEDARLPVESVGWLKESLPRILASINIGVVRQAASTAASGEDVEAHRERLDAVIARQWDVLNRESGLEASQIDDVLRAVTLPDRRDIESVCEMVETEVRREPLTAVSRVADLLTQIEPKLALLGAMHQGTSLAVDNLHDQAAITILRCQVAHGDKTEDWNQSVAFLEDALRLVRGDQSREKIEKNLTIVKGNRTSGSTWCAPGYFDLPEDCLEILDRARQLDNAGSYDAAIDLLRSLLLRTSDISDHSTIGNHASHCLAICLKGKAVDSFNAKLAEFNRRVEVLLNDSVRYRGYVGDGGGLCTRCGRGIYGTYFNRTIDGTAHPFCVGCNSAIKSEWERYEGDLKKTTREGLDIMLLAYAFDSESETVVRNLQAFREDSAVSGYREKTADELMVEYDLLSIERAIRLVVNGSADATRPFNRLVEIIARQTAKRRRSTMIELLEAAAASGAGSERVLPLLADRSDLFEQSIRLVFHENALSAGFAEAFRDGICEQPDAIRFAAIRALEQLSDQHWETVEKILASFDGLARELAEDGLDSQDLTEFLTRAWAYGEKLHNRVAMVAMQAIVDTRSREKIIELILVAHSRSELVSIFYSSAFFSEDRFGTAARESILEAIESAPAVLQFAVLEQLKEMGDPGSPTVKRLLGALIETVAANTRTEMDDGTHSQLGETLGFAKHFRVDDLLFRRVAEVCGETETAARNLVVLLTYSIDERERLNQLLASDTYLDTSARLAYLNAAALHWDPALRARASTELFPMEDAPSRVKRALRMLDDDSAVINSLARAQLLEHSGDLLALIESAAGGCSEAQASHLVGILAELASRGAPMRPPLRVLMLLIARFPQSDMALQAFTLLSDRNPDWADDDEVKLALPWLKHAIKKGGADRRESAAALALRAYRSKSVGRRFSIWLTRAELPVASGGHWCELRPLVPPRGGRIVSTAVDARELLEAWRNRLHRPKPVQSTQPASGPTKRKTLAELVRSVHRETKLKCPGCDRMLSAKNMLAHYDRWHEET